MRTELDVSRIFVQFIVRGVRHARIDSYRKRAQSIPIYPMELELMNQLQIRDSARLLETIPINQISHLEEYIVIDWLSDAVARLNDKEKFIIYCKIVENMHDAEVGKLMGITRSAISKQIHRTYRKLLKVYREDFKGGTN